MMSPLQSLLPFTFLLHRGHQKLLVVRPLLLRATNSWHKSITTTKMTTKSKEEELCNAVKGAEEYFRSNNDGPQPDSTATATIQSDSPLVCKIESSTEGMAPIYTDMPKGIGGTGQYNTPGWHFRAALASCDATLLAIRAARVGIQLDSISVQVDSISDGRGMLLDDFPHISPGSAGMKLVFKVASKTATKEQIEELVKWVEEHSPVGTDVMTAVNVKTELEFAKTT